MFAKSLLVIALTSASLSAVAADYFVVVPVKGRVGTATPITVGLNSYKLPAGSVGLTYPSFDFNALLQVQGDNSFNEAAVSWTIASGTLPAGLTLSANGVLSGTPTAVGTADFTLQAAYKTKNGQQTYQVVTSNLTVALASATLPASTVGTTYAYDFTQLLAVAGDASYNGSGVTWSVVSGALPAGITLNSNGTLTGTPTASGTSTFAVQASYRTKQGQQTYTIAATVNFSVLQLSGYHLASRVNARSTYAQAVAACAGTIDGKSDWRLPTQAEFEGLRATFGGAAGFTYAGWPANSSSDYYWTSTPYSSGHVVRFAASGGSWAGDQDPHLSVCVRTDSESNGMVSYLPLDGTNGSTSFYDFSSTHATVTAVGAAALTTSKAAQGSGSLNLAGGGYLQFANNTAHDLVANQSFTIEADVYPVSLSTGRMVASKRTVNGSAGWNIRVSTTGQLTFWYYDTAFSAVATSDPIIPVNAWTKIAVSREGSTVRLYINGVRSGSPITLGSGTSTPAGMRLGADETGASFSGYIDNYRFTQGVARYTN